MLELGVLISGSGTNLQAILDAIAAGTLDAKVSVVLSNIASAQGLERAKKAGVPTVVIDHRGFLTRGEFDASVVQALREHGVEWVVLAGFMRVLTPVLLDAFPMRVINVHPALLPSFPGTHGARQAIDYGVRVAGCTVHLVDAGTDTGPIVAQAAVPVLAGDDEASLAARILVEEHALLPKALQWIAEGRMNVLAPAA
ncbi:MAG: phosphoribosylglycinamide formyltransferase, partial [Polyangiaceae bacterium]